ncbi:MAG: DUF190 domain-containing protein [Gammaproteobacteria bacterium]|nr:DUF190 domain-containing protein [Gammaproteobacteria bacterium]
MKRESVTMVRIYLSEEKAHLQRLLGQLHDREQVRGVTVFRGISGYGEHGEIHMGGLIDLSLNLPLVVEFFDQPEKIERVLDHLSEHVDLAHIVCWSAEQLIKA